MTRREHRGRRGVVHGLPARATPVTGGSELPARILVIEDDPGIAALVAYQLTRAGYRVETAGGGDGGLESLHREIPDLVVLDRMLPGLSGDQVLAAIREDPATRCIPVLVLTAKREQADRIEGLEMGADDYLTKPFSPRELVLRVEAILRRIRGFAGLAGHQGGVLRAGDLALDQDSMRVTLGGEEVPVTPTEYRLLRVLLENRGRMRKRDDLLEAAWDAEGRSRAGMRTRTVDMHIRRLRTKLGYAGDWIETVRGFGYRFRGPEPAVLREPGSQAH
ncbi:MAG: response regulator transcription factor [Gemmatimonadota bacterium]|nr:response regulator transcription factor [Gemmatimonadota bacterium]MYD13008.1 response regulator transcription factor [Gemmatimonadota bacterium]